MEERAPIVAFLHRLLDVMVCAFFIAILASYASTLLLIATGLARHHSLLWIAFEGLVFSLFTMAYLWAGLLFFAGWIVFFTPKRVLSWSLLLGSSLLAGSLNSWTFQAWPIADYVGPDAMSSPPVEMLSPITYISCFGTFTAISLVALVYSRFEEKSHSATNMLADGSI